MSFQGRQVRAAAGQQLHVAGPIGQVTLGTWPDAATWEERTRPFSTKLPLVCGKPQQRDGVDVDPCGLWRVSMNAGGAIRPNESSAPLTISQLTGSAPLPAGNQRTYNGAPIWAVLDIDSSAGTRRFRVDWGQTLEVNCDGITVGWAAPRDWIEVASNPSNWPSPSWSRDYVVLEYACYVDFARLEAPSAQRGPLKLTETYIVDASDERSFPVPNGASALQMSRDRTGATLTGFIDQGFGDPNVVGALFRRNAAIRYENAQTLRTSIAPGVTHIFPPILAGEQALWTCVWEISI